MRQEQATQTEDQGAHVAYIAHSSAASDESDGLSSHDGGERRRAPRVRRKFVSQMTPWAAGHASVPFEVVIEDMSETGVGVLHATPLEIGLRHLLTVPRGDEGQL